MLRSTRPLLAAGALFAAAGAAGLAFPEFSTYHTTELAGIGGSQVLARVATDHVIPSAAAGGVLLFGLLLIGGGTLAASPRSMPQRAGS